MIVDDEKWIRRGLVQSIEWDRFGLKLVGEAGDGQEAYDMSLAARPDLLFLDMRMPGLDGKQLLSMLERDLPETLTVVVSGYSDFEYTIEAIRHKAFDYVLKPVKKDELTAVLEKAVAELERREAERRQASDGGDWLNRHFLGERVQPGAAAAAAGKEPYFPSGWKKGEYAVMVGSPDGSRDEGPEPARFQAALREQLDRSRPFLFGGDWLFEVTHAPGDVRETVIALCAPQLGKEELRQLHKSMQAALRQAAGGETAGGQGGGASCAGISFGVSRTKRDPLKLAEAYQEASGALRNKALGDTGAMLFAAETGAAPIGAYPQEQENALLLALQAGNREVAAHQFERWLAAFCSVSTMVGQLQRNAAALVHVIGKQLMARGAKMEEVCGKSPAAYAGLIAHLSDIGSVRTLFEEELMPAVLNYSKRSVEKMSEVIVAELRKLVEAQYNQQLSLHQIAGHHYMNPDYVGRLFKKATGKNFVDYVADVRIAKAKELMRMSAYKNYEIAQLVGYEDYRYFSQIFKKKIGMTIGEYRGRHGSADK
jgi:YesN/AraC family two-component response regulator